MLPGGVERAMERVFVGECEADVGYAVAAPSAVDRQKKIGALGDKLGLEFGRDHEVAVTFFDRGQRRKDAPADAEVGCAHV